MYREADFILLNRSLRHHDRSRLRSRSLIIAVEICLRLMGLKRTEKILLHFSKKAEAPASSLEAVLLDRYITIFNYIKQFSAIKGRCLSQSLALRFLLGRQGIVCELKIGVRRNKGAFEAHAWLEWNGELVNDHPSNISSYLPFPSEKINATFKFR